MLYAVLLEHLCDLTAKRSGKRVLAGPIEATAIGNLLVQARAVGEEVMEALQRLDHVAYIRFASVYRRFQDLDEFRAEIDRLSQEPTVSSEDSGDPR